MADLMQQNTATAHQTHVTSLDIENEIRQTATYLQSATDAVIPAHWMMLQAQSFQTVQNKFQALMVEILNAMTLLGTGTITSMRDYIDIDEFHQIQIRDKADGGFNVGELTTKI